MTKFIACALLVVATGCTTLGIGSSLATDCNAQAATIQQAKATIAKLTTSERQSIDADIALSQDYCTGKVVAPDQSSAMKVVQASTVHMAAIVAAASLRK